MRQSDIILTEYVKRLSDDDVSWLRIRCKQDVCGDKAEIVNFLAKDREVDRWLSTAVSAEEFFDMLDSVAYHIQQENGRRSDYKKK